MKVQLRNSVTIDAPIAKVWEALNTPESFALCFPGATLTGYDRDTFSGTVKVKLGPISLTYEGKGVYKERDDAAHRVVIDASGRDSRGNGTAEATLTGTMGANGPDKTSVIIVTDLMITGRPAQFGRGVISDVADKIVGQFASCLARRLVEIAETAQNQNAEPKIESYHPTLAASARAEKSQRSSDSPTAAWFLSLDGPRSCHYWNGASWIGRPQLNPEQVFVSYARKDGEIVRQIVEDLHAAQLEVWLDEELRSGQGWWGEILAHIRASVVFVHTISDSSLMSEACRAERKYADALGLPILMVQVAEANLRASPYGHQQMGDYRFENKRQTARLTADVFRASLQWRPLPDPLPEPPPAPFAYIMRISAELDGEHLSFPEQNRILGELHAYLEEVDEEGVKKDILLLLKKLANRGDTGRSVERFVQVLVRSSEQLSN